MFGVLRPAVSINSILRDLYSRRARILSRVVWGISDTTTLSSPISSLIRVDFPTFGLPIRQILIVPPKRRFLASAPRELENTYSGLIKAESKFSPSKDSFSYGLGLILRKSLSHSPAENYLSTLTASIYFLNFFTTS